jgi:hypothetical protein
MQLGAATRFPLRGPETSHRDVPTQSVGTSEERGNEGVLDEFDEGSPSHRCNSLCPWGFGLLDIRLNGAGIRLALGAGIC